jgi:chemotaxis protein CheX
MIDAGYITALGGAVNQVFTALLQLPVEVQSPRLRMPGAPPPDVSAMIAMAGDLTGTIILSFPYDVAQQVVKRFTGVDLGPTDDDFADATGELVNMVAGNAKAGFPSSKVWISCPSVVVGDQHRVLRLRNILAVEIPCNCECGPFLLEARVRQAVPAADSAPAAVISRPAMSGA